MKRLVLLLLVSLAACSRQASVEAAKLDALLSGGQVNHIEVVIPLQQTNILAGADAQKYLDSFRQANRVSAADPTKAQHLANLGLSDGTNVLGWVSRFDNGTWKFGHYSFRLKAAP